MASQQDLLKELTRIEAQLEKVRGCSPLTHGWQTSRFAKASRSWDILAKRRMEILTKLEEYGMPKVSNKDTKEM